MFWTALSSHFGEIFILQVKLEDQPTQEKLKNWQTPSFFWVTFHWNLHPPNMILGNSKYFKLNYHSSNYTKWQFLKIGKEVCCRKLRKIYFHWNFHWPISGKWRIPITDSNIHQIWREWISVKCVFEHSIDQRTNIHWLTVFVDDISSKHLLHPFYLLCLTTIRHDKMIIF